MARCYQCGKCTAGCPMAGYMDLMPHQVMRLVQIGDESSAEKVLSCAAIWSCAGCLTCTQRCPQELDPAAVMDVLREKSCDEKKVSPKQKKVLAFHRAFLKTVESTGRMSRVRSRPPIQDGQPGLHERRGSCAGHARPGKAEALQPQDARAEGSPEDFRGLPEERRTMKGIGYYPGCSLEGSGIELDLSIRALSGSRGRRAARGRGLELLRRFHRARLEPRPGRGASVPRPGAGRGPGPDRNPRPLRRLFLAPQGHRRPPAPEPGTARKNGRPHRTSLPQFRVGDERPGIPESPSARTAWRISSPRRSRA